MLVNIGMLAMNRYMVHDKVIYVCSRKHGKMFKFSMIASVHNNEYFIYGRVHTFQNAAVLVSTPLNLELDDIVDVYSDNDCTQTTVRIAEIKFRLGSGNLFVLSDNSPIFSSNFTIILCMINTHKNVNQRTFFINHARYRNLIMDMISKKNRNIIRNSADAPVMNTNEFSLNGYIRQKLLSLTLFYACHRDFS